MEFALVMTLLVILLFAIIEFGRVYSQREVYVSAAREGARFAATRCASDPPCDDAKIAARVTEAAVGYSIGPGSPAADRVCDNDTIGQTVTVSWDQNFKIAIPLLPWNVDTDAEIKGVFRCE